MLSDTKKKPNTCTLCGKPLSKIKTLSRVEIKVDCYYIKNDKNLEAMNGLGRHSAEYLCEHCLNKLTGYLKKLVVKS